MGLTAKGKVAILRYVKIGRLSLPWKGEANIGDLHNFTGRRRLI